MTSVDSALGSSFPPPPPSSSFTSDLSSDPSPPGLSQMVDGAFVDGMDLDFDVTGFNATLLPHHGDGGDAVDGTWSDVGMWSDNLYLDLEGWWPMAPGAGGSGGGGMLGV